MEKELLYRFFDGTTTVDEEKQVLDWLDAAPENHREFLAERRLFDAMVLLADDKLPVKRGRIFTLPRWTREVMKYAAVVLVMAGIGGVYLSSLYRQLNGAENTISVPAGQHIDMTLPDGTKVSLNALSELKYPAAFMSGTRKVHLDGEAFFEVKHDEDHPFVVETYACDVKVLGTKFNLEARAKSGEFVTSLLEGRVQVADRTNAKNQVVLNPRQQVRHLQGRLLVSQIPEDEGFLWRSGLIAFRDVSFMELIGEFEKYYGVKIEVQRQSIPQNLFTGKIRIAEGLDHALWVLQRNSDFKYTRNETKDLIYIQ